MQVIHTTNHNCHLTRRAIVPFIVTCYLLCCALCSSLNFSNQIAAAITESTTFTVDNSSTVLEITVPSVISLDLHPTTGYAFGTTNLPVSAGTNNPYGLTLTMSVPNLNLTNTDIVLENNPNNVDTDENGHPIIQNLADGSYTESNFTINRWGYKLSTASNYTPMPTTLELLSTESAANATTTTLNLAAKVDTSRPAGTYSTAINFMAVGNAANCATNLSGCSFLLNESLSFDAPFENTDSPVAINFVSNDTNFTSMFSEVGLNYYLNYNNETVFFIAACIRQSAEQPSGSGAGRPGMNPCGDPSYTYVPNYWTNQNYRTVRITGGVDATNQDLINWFFANATQL